MFVRLLFVVALLSCSFSGALGRDYQTLSDQDFQPMGTVEEFLVQNKQANDREPRDPSIANHFLAQQRLNRARINAQARNSAVLPLNEKNQDGSKIGISSGDGSAADSHSVDIPQQEEGEGEEEEPQYEWGQRAHHEIQHMLVFHLIDPSKTGSPADQDIAQPTKIARSSQGENKVLNFLESIGAQVFKKDFVTIFATAPIGVWERALNTQFFELRTNVGVQQFLHRPKAYSLPKDIAVYVEKVSRTVDVPVRSSAGDPSNYLSSPRVRASARREHSRLKRAKRA